MKYLFIKYIQIILSSFLILNCTNYTNYNEFDFLKKNVKKIVLIDSRGGKFILPAKARKHFISYLQKSDKMGLSKVLACYRVVFYLKNNETKIYKTNGIAISKIGGDIFYTTPENFIKKFWVLQKSTCP